jgi:hypothetical protein
VLNHHDIRVNLAVLSEKNIRCSQRSLQAGRGIRSSPINLKICPTRNNIKYRSFFFSPNLYFSLLYRGEDEIGTQKKSLFDVTHCFLTGKSRDIF